MPSSSSPLLIAMNRMEGHEIVAVTRKNQLTDLLVQENLPTGGSTAGNIYKGIVNAVVPHLQAAFLDIGVLKNGFLSIDNLVYRVVDRDTHRGGRRTMESLLREGDQLMVQVEKEALGEKGPSLTTKISLPGRYVVFMPHGRGVHISRQITQEKERKRLHEIAEEVFLKEGGYIIRTATSGRSKSDLRADAEYVHRIWKRIEREYERTEGIRLLHKELGVVERALRDHYQKEVSAILVGSEEHRNRVCQFLRVIAPRTEVDRLVQKVDPKEVWRKSGVLERLKEIFSNRVRLESGGTLIIEEMEALTAIDVNSGKFSGGSGLDETIYKTNMEAAVEIPKQLRLRQIGGIIVIDFIDMRLKRHRDNVYRALEREMAHDRTPSDTLQFTEIGLVQITRQRTGRSLRQRLSSPCPHCKGAGFMPSLQFE
ncbi:MAG TPA: Rne/Rng family ribonuclease [bacterium]|nr:Rne/Rng family ribonuclease [bacterium]HQO35116.1 Rne/Rng family ribonuclease [bacterium]HQP98140.1 Rne/Rng family ribonuclease [bacterium]